MRNSAVGKNGVSKKRLYSRARAAFIRIPQFLLYYMLIPLVCLWDFYRLEMEEIAGSEWVVFMTMMIHLLLAPGTKVEESFNVQATHDIIYKGLHINEYDHHQFPGVVPRTFAGPLMLGSIGIPLRGIFYLFDIQKFWMLFLVRFILGTTVIISFLNLARCVQKHFGLETAIFFRLILASQFHFFFYSSRPLPNIFALSMVMVVFQRWLDDRWTSAVRWATAVTFLFRCELVLLFAPIFILPIIKGTLPLTGRNGAIFNGIKTAVKVLVPTILLDSLLWGRLLWPEATVAYFNIFLNKSHEYGVSPFLWYFYSVLPRALLSSLILFPLGILLDRRLIPIVTPIVCFVFLYSFLPHKELRFIIYAFPILNLPAAVFCARMYINRDKNAIRALLAYGSAAHLLLNLVATALFVYASAKNYPGSDALGYLQYSQRIDHLKSRSVHMDVMSCQNGISQFLQLYPQWEYNKTEDLSREELNRFDFLIVGGHPTDLKEVFKTVYSSTHRVMVGVPAFDGFVWRKFRKDLPLYYPELRSKEKIVLLKKRD